MSHGVLLLESVSKRTSLFQLSQKLTLRSYRYGPCASFQLDLVLSLCYLRSEIAILTPKFLQYATPTIISGDRENVDVIAHELSHSYSGNLVSNASWEHFWLNEGWTTYLERRIQAAVHGENHRDFSAIIGWKALQDSVAQFGETHEFTKLIVDLKGKDPDDAFSSIPYEKGYTFLSYLEKQVGRGKWNDFVPHVSSLCPTFPSTGYSDPCCRSISSNLHGSHSTHTTSKPVC